LGIILSAVLLREQSVPWGELRETWNNMLLRKMQKEILTAIAISVLLISLLATVCFHLVKADSADFISFPDSGVTIFSPLNKTYYYQNPILNVTLHGAGLLGSIDPQISMNYSIDNMYNGSVPLKSNGEIHVITTAVGTVALPELPSGSHYLTIYLYGWNQRSHEPKYLSFNNTVHFSIVRMNPTSSPTPTPLITPSPSPSPNTTHSPSPTLESEPFPASLVFVASVGIALVVIVLLFYFRKRKP
jgi:hypothetical protein